MSELTISHEKGPGSFVRSGFLVDNQRFTWSIESFDKLRYCSKSLWAHRFEFEAGNSVGLPTKWACFLEHSTTEDNGGKKWIGAFFKLLQKPKDVDEVNASFSMKIKKANGEIFFDETVPLKNMMDTTCMMWGWGFPTMIERDATLEALPLVDEALIIEVDFNLFAVIKPVRMDLAEKIKAFEVRSLDKLSKDLGEGLTLAYEKSDSLTKIISRDNVEFPVNRGVLSARSDVFRRMFQADMREAETGQVQIGDLSGKTIKVLVQYIVTGTLHEDWKNQEVIEELTVAAHRYEFTILTDFLDDVLGCVCNNDNVKNLAVLARRLNLKKAEKDLFVYIKNNAKSLEDFDLNLIGTPESTLSKLFHKFFW